MARFFFFENIGSTGRPTPRSLLPILAKPLEEALAAGEIEVEREELRIFLFPSACRPLAARRGLPPRLRDVLMIGQHLSPGLVAHSR